jgi:phosphoribosylamine--glycine ligase
VRVLLVGKGGRESALAWALSVSPLVEELHVAPGNPGMARFAEQHPTSIDDLEGIVSLGKRVGSDLVVIGPEAPLASGLADMVESAGMRPFGPGAAGARLEASKSFAKSLMRSSGIPTAAAKQFDIAGDALAYVRGLPGPAVVKADGLAAGKGVVVCDDAGQAEAAVVDAMESKRFGAAGRTVLIEEKLEGEELSVLVLFDGETWIPLEPARDYKRVNDGDAGPNTGGMGSYSPVPSCSAETLSRILDEIIEPTAAAIRSRGIRYRGVIYAGLMLTEEGPKVIEYNCRFGDPETQALIPRLESDLAGALTATADGSLDGVKLTWRPDACVCVVAASGGYPGDYEIGHAIAGVEGAESITGLPLFHADTRMSDDGGLITAGGRVLGISGLGYDHAAARRQAYEAAGKVSFEGIHYRTDIASGV